MYSLVQEKSEKLALRIVNLNRHLCNKAEYILSKQILRSGTSVGANIVESEFAISKKEFVAKMQIALKECAETEYWLRLLLKGGYIGSKEYDSMQKDCSEVLKMLTSIVRTSKLNIRKGS